MSSRITIKDVSRATGVSVSTVSNALNAPERVAEETRQKVVEAADRLGYRPNRAARDPAQGALVHDRILHPGRPGRVRPRHLPPPGHRARLRCRHGHPPLHAASGSERGRLLSGDDAPWRRRRLRPLRHSARRREDPRVARLPDLLRHLRAQRPRRQSLLGRRGRPRRHTGRGRPSRRAGPHPSRSHRMAQGLPLRRRQGVGLRRRAGSRRAFLRRPASDPDRERFRRGTGGGVCPPRRRPPANGDSHRSGRARRRGDRRTPRQRTAPRPGRGGHRIRRLAAGDLQHPRHHLGSPADRGDRTPDRRIPHARPRGPRADPPLRPGRARAGDQGVAAPILARRYRVRSRDRRAKTGGEEPG